MRAMGAGPAAECAARRQTATGRQGRSRKGRHSSVNQVSQRLPGLWEKRPSANRRMPFATNAVAFGQFFSSSCPVSACAAGRVAAGLPEPGAPASPAFRARSGLIAHMLRSGRAGPSGFVGGLRRSGPVPRRGGGRLRPETAVALRPVVHPAARRWMSGREAAGGRRRVTCPKIGFNTCSGRRHGSDMGLAAEAARHRDPAYLRMAGTDLARGEARCLPPPSRSRSVLPGSRL